MSRPRQVLPEQFYLVTRRCLQRMFLMRPDAATNNAYIYCLAVAAQACGIDIVATCAMSNHHHTVIFDRHGVFPAFIEHFHKLFARSQNALHQRTENFWAVGQCSVVRLVGRQAIIDKIVYCLTNPVKGMLVERVTDWPGVNSFASMRSGEPLSAKRPGHFFRAEGNMEAKVVLDLSIPPELGERAFVVREITQRIREVEQECAKERRMNRTSVVGAKRILNTSPTTMPTTDEEHRELRPTIACRDVSLRIAVLAALRDFYSSYREARDHWLNRRVARFPLGTYLLKPFSGGPAS